jgi:hypothetical protein
MRIKIYHNLMKLRRTVEQEMSELEKCRGSGAPECQQLYRLAARIRSAELEAAAGQPRPVCPPIIRTHWNGGA